MFTVAGIQHKSVLFYGCYKSACSLSSRKPKSWRTALTNPVSGSGLRKDIWFLITNEEPYLIFLRSISKPFRGMLKDYAGSHISFMHPADFQCLLQKERIPCT